jgi:hypothetical protein
MNVKGRWTRSIGQAVNGRQVRSSGICGGKSVNLAGSVPVFQFPLPILMHQNIHPSSGADTIGGLVAYVPGGLNLAPPHDNSEGTQEHGSTK